jgi:hypothetical protein
MRDDGVGDDLMNADVFLWRAPGLGPQFRVGVTDTDVTIARNAQSTVVALAGIDKVYVQLLRLPTRSVQLHVELVDGHGTGHGFHAAGGVQSIDDVCRCRDAVVTLLRQLVAQQPGVRVYTVGRPGRPMRFVAVGLILLAPVAVIWAVDAFLVGNPERASAIAAGLSAAFVFGTVWTCWRTLRAKPVSVADVLNDLEAPFISDP